VPVRALETSLTYPEVHLRHYEGQIAMVANALLYTGDTVLPDSYRHHLGLDPHNPRTTNVSPDFTRIPHRNRPTDTLRGNFYHLDSQNSGHYGHLMTEVMSRLWGWSAAKEAIPDLKAIFRIRYPGEREPNLEQRLFGAFGIEPDDIVWIDHPVVLESVVAATPMWHNSVPHYVHPGIAEVWQRLGRGLADPSAPEYPKIFVSRKSQQKNRSCRNAAEVEKVFAAHGFEIVYPETYDLSIQAGIFAKARVVAGFGGSGMFNIMHSQNASNMIVLNSESYTARNEHLYASVLGCDSDYFWSRADVAHPEGGWSEEAYYAGWEFDFARNGADLQDLLSRV
jgi:capsular polysaccharide biosynthesis protein